MKIAALTVNLPVGVDAVLIDGPGKDMVFVSRGEHRRQLGDSPSRRAPWRDIPRAGLRSGVASAANSRERRKALFDEGMAKGGIRAATEHFLLSVAGQDRYQSLDPELRQRLLLLNGDVLINIELTPLPEYEPTPAELASMRLPRLVTAGGDNRDTTAPGHWRYEVATHLASQLDTAFAELPGAHMAYLSQPTAFAQALRPPQNAPAPRIGLRGARLRRSRFIGSGCES